MEVFYFVATARRRTGEKENVADRRRNVLAKRKEGKSVRQIAAELSVPRATVGDDLKKVMDELATETRADAEASRALELERLDDMYMALTKKIAQGDYQAIDRAIRISQRRAALLGLDQTSPQSINLNLSTLTDEELKAVAEGKLIR